MNLRVQSKARTRAKLEAAARDHFTRHGYQTTELRSIAKAAGVSTGSIFANWPSKAALFADVMGRPAPDPAAFAKTILTSTSIKDAREAAAIFLADYAGASQAEARAA